MFWYQLRALRTVHFSREKMIQSSFSNQAIFFLFSEKRGCGLIILSAKIRFKNLALTG